MDILRAESSRLTLAADALHPNDNTECLNLGTEYGYRDWLFLRLGYKSLFTRDSEQGLTVGAGLVQTLMGQVQIKLDYAYADFGRLQNAQRFSLGIVF